MNYIDPAEYSELLKTFAKGTKKGMLQENYIDLRPINSLQEDMPTKMSHIYAKYPDSMEEAEVKNPGKYAGGPRAKFDKDGDGVPDGADKHPTDGSKHEGLHLGAVTGPTIQTVEGRTLENLSIDERTQLKEYIRSLKTIKGAIKELLDKAKGMRSEGDTTGLIMPQEEE